MSTAPHLTLYFAPGSSSMAAHIALHEVGAGFEARPLSWSRRDFESPAFRAVNPEGLVPVLVVDGRPLTEVAAILFYLAERFPEAGLLPDDVEGRAHAVSWMSFVASTVHPARQRGAEASHRAMRRAERRLGPREWALDRYSVADIHLFRLFWRFWNTDHPTRDAFPHLAAHYDRMMARPAVVKTLEIEAGIGFEVKGLKLR